MGTARRGKRGRLFAGASANVPPPAGSLFSQRWVFICRFSSSCQWCAPIANVLASSWYLRQFSTSTNCLQPPGDRAHRGVSGAMSEEESAHGREALLAGADDVQDPAQRDAPPVAETWIGSFVKCARRVTWWWTRGEHDAWYRQVNVLCDKHAEHSITMECTCQPMRKCASHVERTQCEFRCLHTLELDRGVFFDPLLPDGQCDDVRRVAGGGTEAGHN
jgi:hypothetical protein